MEDWGLHAVVGGCSTTCFGDHKDDDIDLLLNFPNLFDTTTVLADELRDVYMPFYPIFDPIYSPEIITAPSNISVLEEQKKYTVEKVQVKEKELLSESNVVAIASTTHAAANKNKRRRNQQKRVVLQVTAENLSSDVWAWRKYGQKPIKGSPYPRSYYRCSSSKGCLARKQVEQSCSDPGMFIITYTAEHNHTQPTRRNSLAGTTRQKFLTQKSPTISTDDNTNIVQKSQEHSSTSSPRSTAEEFPQLGIMIKQADEEQVTEMSHGNGFIIPDFVLSENFFAGLEDLDELISDCAFDSHFIEQSPVR